MKRYTVRLANDTVGTIDEDTINFLPIEDWMGEEVTVHLHDENGNAIEDRGKMVEVLDEADN